MSIKILQNPKIPLLDKLNFQGLLGKQSGMCRCESRPCTCSRLSDGLKREKQASMEHQYLLYQPGLYMKAN